MKTKYIHIGYPKNYSTSLQRDYFSKHPDLYHLGIGLNSNLGYRDSQVERAMEVYLKTCKEFKYNEKKQQIKDSFKRLFQQAEGLGYSGVGVSAEHLSFAFSYDGLSASEKARRLFEIFGANTKIIMIVRNQFDLLKSMFRECVRVGFPGDFKYFTTLLYKYQDRNFVYDFRYDLMYDTYITLFGRDQVKVLFFEDYRDSDGQLIMGAENAKLFSDLNEFLQVRNHPMKFGHYNEAIAAEKVLVKAALNTKNAHDLGNHLLESAEKHRIKEYLEKELHFIEEEEQTYSDVITKRTLIAKANNSDQSQSLIYQAPTAIAEFFKTFYADGNKVLFEQLEIAPNHKYLDLAF